MTTAASLPKRLVPSGGGFRATQFHLRAPWLLASSCLLLCACSPYVYKDDIAAFSKGVDETADAFDSLHARALEKYKSLEVEEFADNKDVIVVSPDCTKAVGQGQLVKDTSCLAAWAAYRA